MLSRRRGLGLGLVLGLILIVSQGFAGTHQQSARQQAQRVAAAFLQNLKTLYHLPNESDFMAQETPGVAGHFCIRHAQTLHQEEVIGTFAIICFDPAGKTLDQAANVCDGACLSEATGRNLTSAQAGATAEKELRRILGSVFGRVSKVEIRPIWLNRTEVNSAAGAYSAEFQTRQPHGKFIAYVDAQDGRLVGYENRIFSAEGAASVYQRDPVNTSEISNVTLRGLLSVEKLASPYFEVRNEDVASASSADGNYVFSSSDTHFDEAQVYYGMQFAMGRLMSWGYEPFGTIPIVVHYDEKYNNAFYDGDQIAIGDGDGQVLFDLARDNTVVTHEYGHAIIDHLAHIRTTSWGGNGASIHEGIADYFACAAYGDPKLGEGVMPDRQPLRRCDTDLPFDTVEQEAHEGGQVLSGALWEVRQTLGSDLGDRLALQLLLRVQHTGPWGTTKANDIYRAILAADRAITGGDNRKALKSVFDRRGFKD